MHYELWGLNSGNLIASFPTEEEAVLFIRGLLESDWTVDELSLGAEPDEIEGADPSECPVWEGAALERLIYATV